MASTEGSGEPPVIDVFQQGNKYKGVNLTVMQTAEIYEALQHWETREDDIFLVTYPKSGTHWIFEIASLIMNGAHVDKIDRSHMVYGLDLALTHSVDGVQTVTPGYKAMSTWQSPRIMPTHLLEEFAPEQLKKRKVIYFSRNPKDVCVSWFKFVGSVLPASMEGWNGFVPFFLSDEMFGGSWFRHTKGWYARKDDPNILICKYEDCIKDLRGNVKRIADFMGRPLSNDQLSKIVELTEMKGMQKTYQQIEEKMGDDGKAATRLFGQLPYLRKGKVGGWKDHFTVAQNEYFDKVYKENMTGSGIDFEFEL